MLKIYLYFSRYIAICHPLRARMCFGITPTRWAIIITYVFWLVFLTPQLWLYKIEKYDTGVCFHFEYLRTVVYFLGLKNNGLRF